MEKFRCPTCLTMLEGGEHRCPACRSRLRKRGQPIVLGERARLTSRPLFPVERDMRTRVEAASAPGHPWRREHISSTAPIRPAEPFVPEPAPQPEALEALLAFEASVNAETANETVTSFWAREPEPEPDIDLTDDSLIEPPETAYHPVDIDLTTERESEPVLALPTEPVWEWPTSSAAPRTLSSVSMPTPTSIDRAARNNGEIHEIFEALHRKARAEEDDPEPPSTSRKSPSAWPETTRATRLGAARAHGRRRWHLDFLNRRTDSGTGSS